MFVFGDNLPISNFSFLQGKISLLDGTLRDLEQKFTYLKEKIKALKDGNLDFSRKIKMERESFFSSRTSLKSVKCRKHYKKRTLIAEQQTLSKERYIQRIQKNIVKAEKNIVKNKKNIGKLIIQVGIRESELEYYKRYLSELAEPIQYSKSYDYYTSRSDDLEINSSQVVSLDI